MNKKRIDLLEILMIVLFTVCFCLVFCVIYGTKDDVEKLEPQNYVLLDRDIQNMLERTKMPEFTDNDTDSTLTENQAVYVLEYQMPEPVSEIDEVDSNTYFPSADRYMGIQIDHDDIYLMACIVQLEAGGESFAGQRMVAEVILNRVLQGDMGGSTVHDVIYAPNQFSTAQNVGLYTPTGENLSAVYTALNETPITDPDVVYFAQGPYNDKIFCKIGGHYFCHR